ncbi:translation protein SH3-like domain-containing protein [Usnea florida]
MASTASTLRQSSCLKRLLRQSRQQKTCMRCLSTSPATTPSQYSPPPLPRLRSLNRILHDTTHTSQKKIKTYPPPPSHRAKYPFALAEWQAFHLKQLDPTGSRTRLFDRNNPDVPNVGDILLVTFKTGDPFGGVCLSIKRRGVDTAILLRNRLLMVGVEMWVKIYSPTVMAIEVVKRAEKRARRARLYYMRKPKHDKGSVEREVEEFLKKRRLIRSGAVGIRDPSKSAKNPSSSRSGVGAR